MNILKIILLIICALLLSVILKSVNSETVGLVILFASVISFIFVCTQLEPVIEFVTELANKAGIKQSYMNITLKSIGICFLGDFASQLCKDCGENALAQNTEIVCKCSILGIALPIYIDIFNMILKLWENI